MGRLDGQDRDPLAANLQRHLLDSVVAGSLERARGYLEVYPQFFVRDANYLVITVRGMKGVKQANTDQVCEYIWERFAELKVDLKPAYRHILSEEKGSSQSSVTYQEMITDILNAKAARPQLSKDLFLASIPHDEIKKHRRSKEAFSRLHALTKDDALLEFCSNAYKGNHLSDELGM